MSTELIIRVIGTLIFAVLGARLGVSIAPALGLPENVIWMATSILGALLGLIITPWVTIRPIKVLRQSLRELPVEVLIMSLMGALMGLIVGLLFAYPLSLLGVPMGSILPALVSLISAYVGATTFGLRAREIWDFMGNRLGIDRAKLMAMSSSRQLLLDTSVLIDGRIVDIAKTGFLGGTMLVPKFVLAELHQVADSADVLRRNRGRRGLAKLSELQRGEMAMIKIIEDDVEDTPEVDNKLVALALEMDASIVTNDYNLNKVAEAQGIPVLNINLLANAVRTVYIPGETFPIHVIQEGRDIGQGVGYLEDGTMVVVENGKAFMDRTINVTVTRLINRETGRMIFAVPENDKRPPAITNGG